MGTCYFFRGNSGDRHFRPTPSVRRPFCTLHSAFYIVLPPSCFSPAAPPATDSKRRVSTQRPQSTQRKAQIGERQTTNHNDQGETPPLPPSPRLQRTSPVGVTLGDVRQPASVTQSPSYPVTGCQTLFLCQMRDFPRPKRTLPADLSAEAQRAKVEALAKEGYARPREVMHIKVCTLHGWKECEKGHKNR